MSMRAFSRATFTDAVDFYFPSWPKIGADDRGPTHRQGAVLEDGRLRKAVPRAPLRREVPIQRPGAGLVLIGYAVNFPEF